ncbi:MAG: hypothetical protein ABIY55_24550, partial [Kofleriaceae bacterium]
QRHADAQRILDALEPALAPGDAGNAAYVRGLIAQHTGDATAALAAYEAAIIADPRRWDACCNALTLLLERGDAVSLAHGAALLGRVPPELKGSAPQLLFNEAVYLHRVGRNDEARRNIQRVIVATQGEGELSALALELLAEVSHGE